MGVVCMYVCMYVYPTLSMSVCLLSIDHVFPIRMFVAHVFQRSPRIPVNRNARDDNLSTCHCPLWGGSAYCGRVSREVGDRRGNLFHAISESISFATRISR